MLLAGRVKCARDPAGLSSAPLYPLGSFPEHVRRGVPREHAKTGQKRNFHSFRHTYARIALENGRSLPWLQKHLGHSTLAVTVGIYGHHSEAAAKREVAELEGVFGV